MELRGTKGTMYIRYASWEVCRRRTRKLPKDTTEVKGTAIR